MTRRQYQPARLDELIRQGVPRLRVPTISTAALSSRLNEGRRASGLPLLDQNGVTDRYYAMQREAFDRFLDDDGVYRIPAEGLPTLKDEVDGALDWTDDPIERFWQETDNDAWRT